MIRLLVVKEFTAVSNHHHHSTGDLGSWSNLHTKFYILNDVIWNLLLDFTSDKLLYVDCELQFSSMNLKILQKNVYIDSYHHSWMEFPQQNFPSTKNATVSVVNVAFIWSRYIQ